MILCLTANPALDITYVVPRLRHGTTHRVTRVARAGGKGVNVARVLRQLELPAIALGGVGGPCAAEFRADLDRTGVSHDLVAVAPATRSTTAVVDESTGEVTMLTETGPQYSPVDWAGVVAAVSRRITSAEVLVVSGRFPVGVGPHACAELVQLGHGHGVPVVVDTSSGPHLLAAAKAGADLVKPNLEELRAATGFDTVTAGAEHLRRLGAPAVVVSSGAEGVEVHDRSGRTRARLRTPVRGNPTGAGDSLVAVLAAALAAGRVCWTDVLPRAVSIAGAAVAQPLAGTTDLELADRLRRDVELDTTPPPRSSRATR